VSFRLYASSCVTAAAAGLLLWAGNIDRLLHGASAADTATFQSISTAAQRSAADASSVMFTVT